MAKKMVLKDRLFASGMGGDGSDYLANYDGQVIDIYHVPSDKSLSFKAYLTGFTDQYNSEWNSETTFGRMDPIQTFKSTTRVISLGWDVPASSFLEAKENLLKASILLSMLYPQYEEGNGGASTMSAPPLFKLKFTNLIQDSVAFVSPFGTAKTSGLLGTIAGLTYEPDLDAGFFQPSGARATNNENTENENTTPGVTTFTQGTSLPENVAPADVGKLFPQTIKFQAEFTVLHQHRLGWQTADPKRVCGFGTFPYTVKESKPPQEDIAGGAIPATPPPDAVYLNEFGQWEDADGNIIPTPNTAAESRAFDARNNEAQELKLGEELGECKK